MAHPYAGRPPYTFWKQGVADQMLTGVDPVVRAAFLIAPTDPVATAGSCFAQHISAGLRRSGFNFLVTETFDPTSAVRDENYGVFPARYGNIYSPRQLLQLFDRAYGALAPRDDAWFGPDRIVVDPFRPRIQATGFGSIEQLHADRLRHLAAVRAMFEQCKIFIFTLGLTECWMSADDGCVLPLPPGVIGADMPDVAYRFCNFGVMDVIDDLTWFIDRFAAVNPEGKVILTVSPTPLAATFEDRHVLVSTIASKSILRSAVDEVLRRRRGVAYFPSYEIITGPQSRGRYFGPDMREVNAEGVAFVMAAFNRHFLHAPALPPATSEAGDETRLSDVDRRRMAELAALICDEDALSG